MTTQHCLVTGASSQLGAPVMAALAQAGIKITAWTRHPSKQGLAQAQESTRSIHWAYADLAAAPALPSATGLLVHLAPIDLLPALLEASTVPALRIIAISTCSIRFKAQSASPEEQQVAAQLCAAEQQVRELAERKGYHLTVLRLSMLYGAGCDGTVGVLQKFVQRFGFLVLPAQATGMRQPVHVDDVAQAVLACIERAVTYGKCYELGGADQLSLQQLATCIFTHNQRTPRIITVPHSLLIGLIKLVRWTGLRADWRPGLIARAQQAQIVDHSAAQSDFAYTPRHFDGRFVKNIPHEHN